MAELHVVHSVVQMHEAEAVPPSPKQSVAGAMVWAGVQCVQEQAAKEPQEQREWKKGELIEPCLAISGQSPSGADTTHQGTNQWVY